MKFTENLVFLALPGSGGDEDEWNGRFALQFLRSSASGFGYFEAQRRANP